MKKFHSKGSGEKLDLNLRLQQGWAGEGLESLEAGREDMPPVAGREAQKLLTTCLHPLVRMEPPVHVYVEGCGEGGLVCVQCVHT